VTEERRLEIEIALDATPEQVWEAIATGPGLAAWFAPMEVAPDEDGNSPAGKVTWWEPGKGFAIGPFEYLIEARGGGSTVLRFSQTGFDGDDWENEYEATARGWDLYFHTLRSYLAHFRGRPTVYVEVEGPPASADAFRRLLGDDVAVGKEIHLDLPGVAPADGVVDYVGPMHLGIRTPDALLRFHGRPTLDMPVAVGHHYYGEDFDQAELERAWQSWLTTRLGAG
jgi:hypothetical protein